MVVAAIVWRLLRYEKRDNPGSMRVHVLLLLFALYGLRTSEATGLLLNDVDWKKKTFTVRRSKTYTLDLSRARSRASEILETGPSKLRQRIPPCDAQDDISTLGFARGFSRHTSAHEKLGNSEYSKGANRPSSLLRNAAP